MFRYRRSRLPSCMGDGVKHVIPNFEVEEYELFLFFAQNQLELGTSSAIGGECVAKRVRASS